MPGKRASLGRRLSPNRSSSTTHHRINGRSAYDADVSLARRHIPGLQDIARVEVAALAIAGPGRHPSVQIDDILNGRGRLKLRCLLGRLTPAGFKRCEGNTRSGRDPRVKDGDAGGAASSLARSIVTVSKWLSLSGAQ